MNFLIIILALNRLHLSTKDLCFSSDHVKGKHVNSFKIKVSKFSHCQMSKIKGLNFWTTSHDNTQHAGTPERANVSPSEKIFLTIWIFHINNKV